jgi:hypothetical protein
MERVKIGAKANNECRENGCHGVTETRKFSCDEREGYGHYRKWICCIKLLKGYYNKKISSIFNLISSADDNWMQIWWRQLVLHGQKLQIS